ADVDAILALGKAAPAMTRGALRALEPVETVVAVSDHHEPIPAGELLIGAHPVPDVASLTAGMRLLEAAHRSKGALFLVSGGGSALAEVPAPGVEFDDLSAVYRLMLELGVPITDANTVRSHLSSLKGGRLGAAVDGEITTILISDVGSRFELVAS